MARQAPGIVGNRGVVDFLMWIMTGHATDAPVDGVVALAVGKPVGLKSHVGHSLRAIRRDIGPSAMTPPAEFRYFLGAQPGRLRHRRVLRVPCFDGSRVPVGSGVATSALHAGN